MRYITFILFLFLSFNFFSQNIPERPSPPKLVNDFADVLSASQEQELEDKLVNFDKETSTQIVVLTVKSLDGYDKSIYAYKVGEVWGVGQKKFDNGIVILFKDKTADSKGEVFIAPGYGLEGAVPDATAKSIVENEMIPEFKQGNIYTGIDKAVNTLISLTKGEYTADEYSNRYNKKSSGNSRFITIAIIFIIIIVIRRIFKGRGGGTGGIGGGTIFMGGGSSGGFSNFSSGSGGFGGFGGGSFGGGGAGGSW